MCLCGGCGLITIQKTKVGKEPKALKALFSAVQFKTPSALWDADTKSKCLLSYAAERSGEKLEPPPVKSSAETDNKLMTLREAALWEILDAEWFKYLGAGSLL